MAMNDQITGNVTGKIKFTIDKASWNNLDKFQKKLTSVKKQMSNMDKTINVNAVVKSAEKVAKAQVKADNAVVQSQIRSSKVMERHLKQQQNNMLRMQKDYVKKQEQMVKGANANAGMSGRLSWMFPSGGVSTKASSTLFAQMLKDEENAAKEYDRWWNHSLRNEEKRVKAEERLNRQQERLAKKQGKGRGLLDRETFERKVNTFMEVKNTQLNTEAIRKGYAGTAQQRANENALKKAREDAFAAAFTDKGGDIELFRARVNTAIRTMHTMERTAAANKITFASLRGELVQLTAAYGAFAVTQNVAQAGMKLEGIRAAAKVFTGDEAGTREHMAYLVAMSDRLGVNFMVAAQEFNKFSIAVGSKANKGTQRHIFEALSEYATVLQVDQQQYERAIRSVVQMFSKEQVYA